MRKVIVVLSLLALFASNAWAATSFSVRVSFTIPQRIELNCARAQIQPATQSAYQKETKTTSQEEVIKRDNAVCVLKTILPK
jgi:hypothetical protein